MVVLQISMYLELFYYLIGPSLSFISSHLIQRHIIRLYFIIESEQSVLRR